MTLKGNLAARLSILRYVKSRNNSYVPQFISRHTRVFKIHVSNI